MKEAICYGILTGAVFHAGLQFYLWMEDRRTRAAKRRVRGDYPGWTLKSAIKEFRTCRGAK